MPSISGMLVAKYTKKKKKKKRNKKTTTTTTKQNNQQFVVDVVISTNMLYIYAKKITFNHRMSLYIIAAAATTTSKHLIFPFALFPPPSFVCVCVRVFFIIHISLLIPCFPALPLVIHINNSMCNLNAHETIWPKIEFEPMVGLTSYKNIYMHTTLDLFSLEFC